MFICICILKKRICSKYNQTVDLSHPKALRCSVAFLCLWWHPLACVMIPFSFDRISGKKTGTGKTREAAALCKNHTLSWMKCVTSQMPYFLSTRTHPLRTCEPICPCRARVEVGVVCSFLATKECHSSFSLQKISVNCYLYASDYETRGCFRCFIHESD